MDLNTMVTGLENSSTRILKVATYDGHRSMLRKVSLETRTESKWKNRVPETGGVQLATEA